MKIRLIIQKFDLKYENLFDYVSDIKPSVGDYIRANKSNFNNLHKNGF